jgi:hypothetical protein
MPEAFSHSEGTLHLWTGTATASALVAYVQNIGGNFINGWLNEPRGDLSYRNVQTGQRVDLQIGTYLTPDFTLHRLFASATAVHAHLRQFNSAQGSAGYFFYSGRIDSLALNGSEGGLVSFNLTYHANRWSAYGS